MQQTVQRLLTAQKMWESLNAETKNYLQVSATGISKGFGRVHTLKEAL